MRRAVQGPLQGLVFVVLIGAASFLAGCGGGGGNGNAGTPVQITASLGGVPTDATLVAFQDGSGPWQPLTVTRAGGYTGYVRSSDGKYGVAVVQGTPRPQISVFYATTAETTDVPINRYVYRSASGWTVSGTITGIGAGGEASIMVPDGGTAVSTDGPYTVTVSPGANDLLAVRSAPGAEIDRYVVRREANIASDLTWNIDFTGADSLVPVPVTVACPGTADATVACSLRTKGGAAVGRAGTGSVVGKALPVAARVAGDVYTLGASKQTSAASDSTSVQTLVTVSDPVDTNLTLPPAATGSISTASTSPYAMLQGQWTWTGGTTCVMVDGSSGESTWNLTASAGWLGSATSLTAPNLSGVAGWLPAWNPTSILTGGVLVVHCDTGMGHVGAFLAGLPLPAGVALQTSGRRFW